jgi:endonuclease/exonuclease/phosphatase (EEP) superfamily protein YafD
MDSRKGFGLQATWPASLGMFGITLDHFLVTEDWKVAERKVLEDIGSDHAPIYIQLKKTPFEDGG